MALGQVYTPLGPGMEHQGLSGARRVLAVGTAGDVVRRRNKRGAAGRARAAVRASSGLCSGPDIAATCSSTDKQRSGGGLLDAPWSPA